MKNKAEKLGFLLEYLYEKYNRREYVHPDPLEFLYDYKDICDREIIGLIASSLAYGKVDMILRSVETVLTAIEKPKTFVIETDFKEMKKKLRKFKHRFTGGEEIAGLLSSAGRIIKKYGSLEKCFFEIFISTNSMQDSLKLFAERIRKNAPVTISTLIPDPAGGSAFKRLNLMLRWMIRKDDVDPGGWSCLSPKFLIIPCDVHMHKIGLLLGFTGRKQVGMKTAVEITESFRKFAPDDPCKYDFCLTRFGIRDDMGLKEMEKLLPMKVFF